MVRLLDKEAPQDEEFPG